MKFDVFWESTERGVFRMEADSKDAASDELFLEQLSYANLVGTGIKSHFDYDIKEADLSVPDDSVEAKPLLGEGVNVELLPAEDRTPSTIIYQSNGLWFFHDETGTESIGPFETEDIAKIALQDYVAHI
jgi:hypothetical protein